MQHKMTDNDMTKAAAPVPLSAHPIFPLVVATWFAALFGIGSLLLPVILFETALGATGISAWLPAAQAPFGLTARVLVGAVAALIGAIAGVLIARRFAIAQRGRDGRPARRTAAKTPIISREELGSDSLDTPVDPSEAQAEGGPFAPVPPEPTRYAPVPPEPTRYAAERRAFGMSDDGEWDDPCESAPLPGRIEPDEEDLADNPESGDLDPNGDRSRSVTPVTPEAPPVAPANASAIVSSGRGPIAKRSLHDMGIVELVERFAIALQNAEPSSFARTVAASEPLATKTRTGPGTDAEPMVFRRARRSDITSVDAPSASSEPDPSRSMHAHAPQPMVLKIPDLDQNEDAERMAVTPDPVVRFPRPDALASQSADRIHAKASADLPFDGTADLPPAMPPPHARPFDAPDVPRSDRSNGTEKALRDALERLQQMSGAA
ncbi:MAG: hypothetical protein WA948_12105 [Pontixanthobacter sp.]